MGQRLTEVSRSVANPPPNTNSPGTRVILQTKQEQFTMQLQATLDKGFAGWAKQVVELHTY